MGSPETSVQRQSITRGDCAMKKISKIIKMVKVSSYIAQCPIFMTAQSAFYTVLPDRPVQSNTILASLGSIQPSCN